MKIDCYRIENGFYSRTFQVIIADITTIWKIMYLQWKLCNLKLTLANHYQNIRISYFEMFNSVNIQRSFIRRIEFAISEL